MALTDTALKALKPRDKTYTVSDDRGLYLEIFPTGGMVWRYRYRLNGRYEKLTLGKYPALTLKNARLMRDGASQMAAVGESPAQKKQRAKVAGPEDTTLSEFAERYFREIQQRDRKDNTMPRRYLDKDILPSIGGKRVSALEGAQATADRVRTLPDGRIRYYDKEALARTQGPTRGRSHVTEWSPTTGQARVWEETYDHSGAVNRVHPKMSDGEVLDLPHYPPTKADIDQGKSTPSGREINCSCRC